MCKEEPQSACIKKVEKSVQIMFTLFKYYAADLLSNIISKPNKHSSNLDSDQMDWIIK